MDLSENVRVFVRICLQRATLNKLDPKMPASDFRPKSNLVAMEILVMPGFTGTPDIYHLKIDHTR